MYLKHTKTMPRWLTTAIPVVTLPGFFLLVGCQSEATNGATPVRKSEAVAAAPAASVHTAALTVNLVNAKEVAWAQTITTAGDVAPWQESVVGFEVGGQRIVSVLANVGDTVKKGQPLAELDRQTLTVELSAAKAMLAETQAQEAQAISTLERLHRLTSAGGVSEQDLAQQKTSVLMSQAKVASATAQVSALELKLTRSTLVAPDDGVIVARTAALGAIAPGGSEMFRLIRQSRLEWRAEVTSSSLHLVKAGQAVRLKTPQGDIVVGKVRQIAPSVNLTDRVGLVYVDLQPSSSIKSGMHLSGELVGAPSMRVTVPMSAVTLLDGKSYVFSVVDGVAKRVQVEVGRSGTGDVEILAGLSVNTPVVAQGAGFLKDGDKVRVVAPLKEEKRSEL